MTKINRRKIKGKGMKGRKKERTSKKEMGIEVGKIDKIMRDLGIERKERKKKVTVMEFLISS